MFNSYSASFASRLGLAALLAVGGLATAQAQNFGYAASTTTNVSGTYTDLGTNGTVIATTNTDDANSTAQNIGFNFNYNGTTFTQFVLNTNGLLRLGASAPSSAAAFPTYGQTPELGPINSTNAADVNLLLPFNFDLTAGTSTPEYRVYTTGNAGSRVCTIQWKNVADKAIASSATVATSLPTQLANFSFQVKLYETSNLIEFVYSSATAGSTSALKYAVVGLKGSGNAFGQNVLAYKNSSAAWNTTVFTSGPQGTANATNAHNFRSTFLPDAGRTYRFNICTPAAVTFPYAQNFNGVTPLAVPCGYTVNDANGDYFTWTTSDISGNGTDNAMFYAYNSISNTTAANDWFFTPALPLQTGLRYQLAFSYAASDASYPEGLEVKIGTGATPAGQTTTLFSNTNITTTFFTPTVAGTSAGQVASFVPPTTGTYYVGFHAISAADSEFLGVDDIAITAATITATKSNVAPGFSAEASPVPFGEQLSLKLNTLQAGALELTLHDAVGRVVRQTTTTVPAGASSLAVPEAGTLPAGVYLLTVRQGGNTQVIRVAHE
jgi:hypothetical protein